jgi:putative ABC transport system substrate-binding protein
MTYRRKLIIALLASWLGVPLASFGQQPAKVARIGFLEASSPSAIAARIEAFRQGLRELGYVEGKNVVIEYRYAEGNFDRLPALAAEMVRLNVNVIVTGGPTAIPAAKAATTAIPIVMAFDTDPVGSGFAASLAKPGGNITGLSTLAPELSAKQIELLKEIVPKLARVAVLGTASRPGSAHALREVENAAKAFKVQVQFQDVVDPKGIDAAFLAARKGGADAVLVLGSPLFNAHRTELTELATKSRYPVIYDRAEFVEAGGLMTYSVSLADLARRAATYVDKILKGAKPGDLPIEQPTKFELVVNMKTAKALGIKIPNSVLAQATKVIE